MLAAIGLFHLLYTNHGTRVVTPACDVKDDETRALIVTQSDVES